ncbi:hypothetical protein B0H14DRAFT_3756675 [Mycena olivaceomarginata]|nr:hypothetical protein B0H14DRAFT_3756675 [Mycena olivaceomarginata]
MGPARAASGDCRRWTDAGGAGGCAMKPVDGVAQQWCVVAREGRGCGRIGKVTPWRARRRRGSPGGGEGALRGGRSGGGTERRQDKAGVAAHGMDGVDAGETGARRRGLGVRSGGSRRPVRGRVWSGRRGIRSGRGIGSGVAGYSKQAQAGTRGDVARAPAEWAVRAGYGKRAGRVLGADTAARARAGAEWAVWVLEVGRAGY